MKRNEEIQEFVEKIPGWISRWGIIVIGLIFTLIILLSLVIKYPDIIIADVIVNSDPPVQILISRTEGKIKLLKQDNGKLESGEIIAFFVSNANPIDILKMDSTANTSYEALAELLNEPLELGDLQTAYTHFSERYRNYNDFLKLAYFDKQIDQLNKQLKSLELLNKILLDQNKICERKLILAYKDFRRDSLLLTQKVLSEKDFQNSESNLLQQEMSCKQTYSSIISNRLQLESINKQKIELEIKRDEELNKLTLSLKNSLKELKATIKLWKDKYLVTSPISGNLNYLHFIKDNSFIKSGEELFAVTTSVNNIFAEAEVPIEGSGKVFIGQKVNIKLKNYPFEQFGILNGEISRLSNVALNGKYLARISLNNGLITSHNITLKFKHNLSGQMEIITKEYNLLERIYFRLLRASHKKS
ncbi:MAG: hypothetical protein ACK5WV_13230 [Chryseotalea sp.]|jgi:hypothetical protein